MGKQKIPRPPVKAFELAFADFKRRFDREVNLLALQMMVSAASLAKEVFWTDAPAEIKDMYALIYLAIDPDKRRPPEIPPPMKSGKRSVSTPRRRKGK